MSHVTKVFVCVSLANDSNHNINSVLYWWNRTTEVIPSEVPPFTPFLLLLLLHLPLLLLCAAL